MEATDPAVPRAPGPPGVHGLQGMRGPSACLPPQFTLSPTDGGAQPGPVPKSLQKQRRVLERLVSSEGAYGHPAPAGPSWAMQPRPPRRAPHHSSPRVGLGPKVS